jgi:hypothetical protein
MDSPAGTVWTSLAASARFSSRPGSPVRRTPVPAPPGGLTAAMTDAQGPGTHVLYQDFAIPATPVTSALLRFDVFIGNRATAFSTPSPASLDFSTPALNQQARVDILAAGADPLTVSASDILLNALQTMPGNPLISGYNTLSVDLTGLFAANPGSTLRLRFAEVDNVAAFQLGIDNVNITIPEPSAIVLSILGGLLGVRRAARRPLNRSSGCTH